MDQTNRSDVAIIGAGFCGLAAAYELSKHGVRVKVFERDGDIGGLAGSFRIGDTRLEKFYHHWFTNDRHVFGLIEELGLSDQVVLRPTRTGMYYAQDFFRLSTPLDVLRFTPLPLPDRFRLGLLALRVRRVTDWQPLERETAGEWLRRMGGRKAYEVVWEPLLRGKFGDLAADVSAVWFWNKLKLRGGSRGKGGEEQLAYFKGGFGALAERVADRIVSNGGSIELHSPVESLVVRSGRVVGIESRGRRFPTNAVIATAALPQIADLVEAHTSRAYVARLRRIRYLGNVCLVMELQRSLSDLYWMNVADPTFPFVGVIEHTNFEPSTSYGGRHLAYLSKYLPDTAPLFRMSNEEVLEFTIPHLQRMFPSFRREWIVAHHVWRARFSQPVVERHYSALIPPTDTPLSHLFIATMAQVYPEDRGTNYAIRDGRGIAKRVLSTALDAGRDTSSEAEIPVPAGVA
jgi:protoporphyrinogen oxidase